MKRSISGPSNLRVNIIVGTTRQERFGDKPALWIHNLLQKREGVTPTIVDLRDYPMPFFNEAISPAYSPEPYKDEQITKWRNSVASADAYIIVAAEYNHGYSAVLKNALDSTYYEWAKKPVGFVGYGSVGGARSIEQLRQVAVELQMVSVKNSVNMPFQTILDVQGITSGDNLAPLAAFEGQAEPMIEQLMWWGSVLKEARD